MASRLAIAARMAAIVASTWAALSTGPLRAQERAAPDPFDQTFQAILACLSHGQEAVFGPKLNCAPYGKGDEVARRSKMPLGEPGTSWDDVCRNRDDPRRLPPDLIKRIMAQKDTPIAPAGIRIIGGVFCGNVDLVGLDLPYSLVIDRSVVNGIIDGRNFRTKADFSFDNTVVLRSLLLNRARIEGSVYGSRSFLDRLMVNDSQINGTWWQTESVIFTDAHFHRTTIAGDLRMNESAFTRLWILSSTIGGTVLLDDSEARCAYHISSNTMGFLTANGAGFGQMQSTGRDGRPGVDYPWWQRAVSASEQPYTKQLLESSPIKRITDAKLREIANKPDQPNSPLIRGCEDTSHSAYLEFYLFDNTVRTAMCLTSFAWLNPKAGLPDYKHPVSILALDGTKVGGKLIVDLWPDPPTGLGQLHPGDGPYDLVTSKNKFEAIGVSASALIYNFADNAKPYFTYVDGLRFDQIHKAQPACRSDIGAQLATQVELPNVDEVMAWLNKNAAPSSQPFTAFVTAFERAGEKATDLRVRRQTYELCEKTARWLPMIASLCPRYQLPDPGGGATASGTSASAADGAPGNQGVLEAIWNVFSATGELIMIGFDWTLYLLADHGLRPAKVVWSVVLTLIAFFALFWVWLRVVGFEPDSKKDQPAPPSPIIWPITFLFLFDRLIPAYKIRDEHYEITKVYRRATKSEIKAGSSTSGGPLYPMPYYGRKIQVCPGSETELTQANKWLVILRIIGVIFTIFLLAAINTLVHS